jgi:hypothetical protein
MIRFSQWASSGFLVELFSIFLFFEAFARWIAMMTCRVPVWPKEIEDDARSNPMTPSFGTPAPTPSASRSLVLKA